MCLANHPPPKGAITHDVGVDVHPRGEGVTTLEEEIVIRGLLQPPRPEVVAECLSHDNAVVGNSVHACAGVAARAPKIHDAELAIAPHPAAVRESAYCGYTPQPAHYDQGVVHPHRHGAEACIGIVEPLDDVGVKPQEAMVGTVRLLVKPHHVAVVIHPRYGGADGVGDAELGEASVYELIAVCWAVRGLEEYSRSKKWFDKSPRSHPSS